MTSMYSKASNTSSIRLTYHIEVDRIDACRHGAYIVCLVGVCSFVQQGSHHQCMALHCCIDEGRPPNLNGSQSAFVFRVVKYLVH